MMTTIPKTTPLLLLSLLICSYQQPCSAIPRPVAGTSWQLHSIALPTGTIDADGAEVTELTPVLPGTTVTAIFGDDGSQVAGTLTGSGGCNDYFSDFEVDLPTMGISFDHVGSTEMDCGEEIMEQEFAYFAALDRVSSHDIFGDTLKLRDESGTTLLLFIPLVDTANLDDDTSDIVDILVGTEWTATSYLSPDTSDLVPIQPGSKVTITFESETNLKGNGGCNSYFGSYASAPYDEQPDGDGDVGGRLAIFEMGWTEMGCIDPPGRMDQEMAYFSALQSAAKYRLTSTSDGDAIPALLVLDDDGVVVLAFLRKNNDLSLSGTSWLAMSYRNDDGTGPVSVLSETTITLVFVSEDSFRGNGGCNHYGGSYASSASR